MGIDYWLFIIFVAVTISQGELSKSNNTKFLDTIRPGIIFEQLSRIGFTHEEWNLVVIIDCVPKEENLSTINKILYEIKNQYTSEKEKEGVFQIIRKLQEVYTYLEVFKEKCNLGENETDEDERLYYKEAAGKIDQFPKRIYLNETTRTIILKSTMQYTGNIFNKHLENLTSIFHSSNKTNNTEIVKTIQETITNELFQRISYFKNLEYIQKHSNIFPGLIDSQRFQTIIKQVKKYSVSGRFPLRTKKAKIEQLNAWSKTKQVGWNNLTFIKIKIPMVTEQIKVYKINTFPVPQKILSEEPGTAEIIPKKEYILTWKSLYYEWDNDDLDKCTTINEYTICPKPLFLLFKNESNCIHHFLTNETKINFRNCKINYITGDNQSFIKIAKLNGWFYSTTRPINITIDCINQERRHIELHEIGTIRIQGNCKLYYKRNEIKTNQLYHGKSKFIKIPKVNLKLDRIAPILQNKKEAAMFIKLAKEGTISFWKLISLTKDGIIRENQNEKIIIITIIISVCFVSASVAIIAIGMIFKNTIMPTSTPEEDPRSYSTGVHNMYGEEQDRYSCGSCEGASIQFTGNHTYIIRYANNGDNSPEEITDERRMEALAEAMSMQPQQEI